MDKDNYRPHCILGITNNDDSSACLIVDGRITAAVQEERFSRLKGHKGWPEQSIGYVLNHNNLTLGDVTDIAYGWSAGFNAEKHLHLYTERTRELRSDDLVQWKGFRERFLTEITNDKRPREELVRFCADHTFRGRTHAIDHHEAHALGSYATSPYDDALVITCDGRGDFQSLTVTVFTGVESSVLQRETSFDSLGFFYGRITKLLGFSPNKHEGKITGLAAHGSPEKCIPLMQEMIRLKHGRVRAVHGDFYKASYNDYSDTLIREIEKHSPQDIAAAAQLHLETIICEVIQTNLKKVKTRNICLAGGVFGNVKLNQKIREIEGVKSVSVLPCMGDGGLALAAAAAVCATEYESRPLLTSMALGPEFENDECEKILTRSGLCVRKVNIKENILQFLKTGKVIGIFRGRLEYGPRALCNRSIIFHAKDKSINEWLNKKLNRTEFMPFAPITADNLAHLCYEGWSPSHFCAHSMTMTYTCTDLMKKQCPAVVHRDGTARPQIITKESDPFMHELLNDWYNISGEPALINTSFNRHEEPIIHTPEQAASTVIDGIIAALFVNDYLLATLPAEH